MGIVLTKHDLLLFKYLFECNFLTRKQINKYIWKERDISYVKKRLWLLTKNSFLKKRPDPLALHYKKSVLMPTEKALQYLELHRNELKEIKANNKTILNYYHPQDYYSCRENLDLRQYEHDKDMNTLRLYLEEYGANNWIPHNVILKKRMFGRYPDGVFKNKNRVFAIELEYNQKAKYVLKKIFKKYQHDIVNKKIDFILYITKTQAIADAMLRYFTPEMIENFIDIVEEEDDNGKIVKKEKPIHIYRKFFVNTFANVMNSNFLFEGNKINLNLKEAFS